MSLTRQSALQDTPLKTSMVGPSTANSQS